jgi:hypothetical protein
VTSIERQRILDALVAELEDGGAEVIAAADTAAYPQPTSIRGYVPDLIATRADGLKIAGVAVGREDVTSDRTRMKCRVFQLAGHRVVLGTSMPPEGVDPFPDDFVIWAWGSVKEIRRY